MGLRSLTLRITALVFLATMASVYLTTWPFVALMNTIFGPESFDSPTMDNFGYPYAHGIIENAIRHDAGGSPYLEMTPALRDYRSSHPKFRFALFDGETGPAVPGSNAEVVAVVRSGANRPVTLDSVSVLPGSKELGMGYGNAHGLPFVFYGFSFQWPDIINVLRTFLPSDTQMAAGALASLAVSWIVAHHALTPLRKATQKIAEIDADALDRRILLSELPSEVVPFASAVNDALARVESGIEAQKRFVANAAHELRTPITIICTHIDDPHSDEATFRRNMKRDALRIKAIVEQLLAAATLSNQQEAVDEKVDLGKAILDIISDYIPLAIENRRKIELDCPSEAIIVRGNRRAIESIVANLIDNALRAEPEGGRVRVRVLPGATVEVVDHGDGVAPEDREKIFEPFWRKDNKVPGTGLGLSIVKEMMDKQGGRVWVEETPGGGATFKLWFPTIEEGA